MRDRGRQNRVDEYDGFGHKNDEITGRAGVQVKGRITFIRGWTVRPQHARKRPYATRLDRRRFGLDRRQTVA